MTAGMEQVCLERAAVLGNPPQEGMVKGTLMESIPVGKRVMQTWTGSQGCVSHIAVIPGGILWVLTFLGNP